MNAHAASSEPFLFHVGEQGREFTIHSALVASQSEPLKKLVEGHFIEGATKRVSWRHVDECTFVSFWQYVYTGDYSIHDADALPENRIAGNEKMVEAHGLSEDNTERPVASRVEIQWNVAEPAASPERQSVELVEDEWGPLTLRANSKKKKGTARDEPTKKDRLWSKFVSLRRSRSDANKNCVNHAAELGKHGKGHPLDHAKVYTFAECYGVLPLMVLSYNKLHQSLIDITYADELAGFVALARFCYESLVPDDLKELVIIFTACKIDMLWWEVQFQDLLKTHGELSKNVIGSLRSRLA